MSRWSQMSPLMALGWVRLICCLTTVSDSALGANAASINNNCCRNTCLGTMEYDSREVVCCENHLHKGAWLSCCGTQAFNPSAATCCKTQNKDKITANVNQGLSETVSACCGLKAYDSLNEICCQSTVVAKPAPKARCCGKEAYDKDKQMCCGPLDNKKILMRNSSHHLCCGRDNYDNRTQCCCSKMLKTQPINSSCCEKDSVPSEAQVQSHESTNMSAPSELKDSNTLNPQLCGAEAYDKDKQMCCGPLDNKKILMRNSSHHLCCGRDNYDNRTQCCCSMMLKTQPINSSCCEKDSVTSEAQDQSHELTNMSAPSELKDSNTLNPQLCGAEAYDKDKQMCCGPLDNKKILMRNSSHHLCCGHDNYDNRTQCCCSMMLKTQPINSSCCEKDSVPSEGVQQQNPRPQRNCTSACSLCYNLNGMRCCGRNQTKSHWCCARGRRDAFPAVRNQQTHVCCDGCVSERKPWKDQCCGKTPYGWAERGVLCCNNTLYKDREDGEECSESNIPYNPAKGTVCCSQFHGSPGQHCCGRDLYEPVSEICCNGHRRPRAGNTHCCGVNAYNIKDQQVKCCAGTLHNLTDIGMTGHDPQCCGSILQNPKDVCCSCEDKELLYTKKAGFGCCGHHYYNTSLWSCCADKLSPVHQPGQNQSNINESQLLSLNNLNKTVFCEKMLFGTVESVSLRSIVFHNVLIIYGRNGTVEHLLSPHIWEIPDRCNFPKLTPGKTYFFDKASVFKDFNHDSIHESLVSIISKCSHH